MPPPRKRRRSDAGRGNAAPCPPSTDIPRACGLSSTPRLLDSTIGTSEYWIARFPRAMTAGIRRAVIALERSDEAIHSSFTWRDGLLRFARNDVAPVTNTRSRPAARFARGVHLSLASLRAWGMPDARCTRGLVCTLYW